MLGNSEVDADVLKGIIKGVLGKKAAWELEDEATKATNSECDSPEKLKPDEADDFDPATPSEQAKPTVAWDPEIAHAGKVLKWKRVAEQTVKATRHQAEVAHAIIIDARLSRHEAQVAPEFKILETSV